MTERETVTEAVEAAARAMWAHEQANWDFLAGGPEAWDEQHADTKADWLGFARAALEAALPLIVAGEREKPQTITLGVGEVIVGHGIHEGLPCMGFTAAKVPGQPGDDAAAELDDCNDPASWDVILRFANMDGACEHLRRLNAMMEAFAAAIRADKGGE